MTTVRPINIGSLQLPNNLLMAPLAGYTQRAQRLLARRYGAAMAFTEMISAYEVLRPSRVTRKLLEIVDQDHPLGIQIFGQDPAMVADAAARAQQMGCFDLVDLNLACPVRKMLARGNCGAMLKDPQAALAQIEKVRRATTLPLMIKIRRGFDDSPESRARVEEILTGAARIGIDAAIIHGRTVQQIYHGRADWQTMSSIAALVDIPVFGSGDLMTATDVIARLSAPRIAGASLARGAIGSPWIFREVLALSQGHEPPAVTPEERSGTMREHYAMLRQEIGDYSAIRVMRRFGMFYSKGLSRAREARLALGRMKTPAEFEIVIHDFFERHETQDHQ
jgi:tRNA-dihydrouridine synthase B